MAKVRLSAVLSPCERKSLTVVMLEDVLRAVKLSPVHQTVVISPDSTVKGIVNKCDVMFLSENQSDLNAAIEQATKWCTKNHFESTLVIPADVPLISPQDISKIIKLGVEENSLVLSPSSNGGTNALFRRPADLIETSFGPESYARHFKKGFEIGIEPNVYRSKNISIDIDSQEDLTRFLEIESHTLSKQFLERIGLRKRLSKRRQDSGLYSAR